MKYRRKIFIYFLFVFIGFTSIIVLLQLNREREYKINTLRSSLDSYAELIHKYRAVGAIDSTSFVLNLLPPNLRLTVIEEDGRVCFDNTLNSAEEQALENHLHRPEVATSRISGVGSSVRYSDTNEIDYYYYSKYLAPYFVRVALPYDLDLQNRLKADKYFLYFIFILFITLLVVLLYISDRFGRAISGLNEFLSSVENKDPQFDNIKFPDTEIGEIGHKIVKTYALLEQRNSELDNEREKLLRHFHYLDEGVSIYSANRENIYSNAHFIQHLNTIIDEPTFNVDAIFSSAEFKPMVQFLDSSIRSMVSELRPAELPVWQGKITKGGNHFAAKLIVFQDSSFEVTLSNISQEEKNRILKHEMTNNIAHELRTPVSTVSGYLETLLDQKNIEPDRQRHYLQRMDIQVKRLSDLIRDIALITKTEEAANLFYRESVNIGNTVEEVVLDLQSHIKAQRVVFTSNISENISINGSQTLIYAIFRNLIENAINYGGEDITVTVDNYTEDEEFYYFKLSDSGIGVSQEHLLKIFARFYRVDSGRSRKSGGSGLGLSIVKNAIKFHGGDITAKSGIQGGLEFVFSLRKSI